MRLLDIPARFTAGEMRMLQSVRGRHLAEQFLRERGQLDDARMPERLAFIKWMVISERINDGETPLPAALALHAVLRR